MLSRRLRPALLVPVLALGLTACVSEPEPKTAKGFDAVTITGEPGAVPSFDWKAQLDADKPVSEVLAEGDGAVVEDGQQLLINLAISSDFFAGVGGSEGSVDYDTFGPTRTAYPLTLGEESADPLLGLIADQIEAGTTTVGTRIGIVTEVKEAFGEEGAFGLGQFGVANEDGIAVVADISGVVAKTTSGEKKTPAAWAPTIERDGDGRPVGLDSAGVPKPDVKGKEVRVTTVLEGTGAAVEPGQLAVVRYLGQTWGGEEPFDGNFGKGAPLSAIVGAEATGPGTPVIEGWSDALVGIPTGSRIIVEIPPAKGYGKQGSEPDIKGDDILYFVIDVLGAA